MFKVTETGGYHSNAMLIAIVERQLVLNASARLYNRRDALVTCYLHTIGEGEESITCHDSTVQVKAEALCFLNGLLQSIHTAGLPYSACQQLFSLCQHNRVRLGIFHNLIGKQHIFHLLRSGKFVGHRFSSLREFLS